MLPHVSAAGDVDAVDASPQDTFYCLDVLIPGYEYYCLRCSWWWWWWWRRAVEQTMMSTAPASGIDASADPSSLHFCWCWCWCWCWILFSCWRHSWMIMGLPWWRLTQCTYVCVCVCECTVCVWRQVPSFLSLFSHLSHNRRARFGHYKSARK